MNLNPLNTVFLPLDSVTYLVAFLRWYRENPKFINLVSPKTNVLKWVKFSGHYWNGEVSFKTWNFHFVPTKTDTNGIYFAWLYVNYKRFKCFQHQCIWLIHFLNITWYSIRIAIKRMQTGCGRGCLSKSPSRKTYEESPTGIKCENKTVMAKSSCQAVFHLALLGRVLLLHRAFINQGPSKADGTLHNWRDFNKGTID